MSGQARLGSGKQWGSLTTMTGYGYAGKHPSECTDHDAMNKPITRSSSGIRTQKMNIEKMRIEDILNRVDIQANLRNFQSENKEDVRSALLTVAYAAQLCDRRDCLIALAGYYVLEVRSIDDLEFFIKATQLAHSPELAHIVLNDLIRNREVSRRRLFINDLVNLVGTIFRKSTPEQAESLTQLIDSAVWGEKLKIKFRMKLRSIP